MREDATNHNKWRSTKKRKKRNNLMGISYCSNNMQKSKVLMIIMAVVQMMTLGRSAQFNEDQCDYGDGSGFSIKKGTPPNCIVFTNGIDIEQEPQYNWAGSPQVFLTANQMSKCAPGSHHTEYAYKSINQVDISTLIIVSDFRNSQISSVATLAVGFTDSDPSLMGDSELSSLAWQLDTTDMTKIYDFSTSKHKAKYLVLKYTCPSGDCMQARIHQIACYQEELVDQSSFSPSSTNAGKFYMSIKFVQLTFLAIFRAFLKLPYYLNNEPVQILFIFIEYIWSYSWNGYTDNKKFLLANSAFSIDCNDPRSYTSQCTYNRISLFETPTELQGVVSLNMVPGIRSTENMGPNYGISSNKKISLQEGPPFLHSSYFTTIGLQEYGQYYTDQTTKVMSMVFSSRISINSPVWQNDNIEHPTYRISGLFMLSLPPCQTSAEVYFVEGIETPLEISIPNENLISFSWNFVDKNWDYDCQADIKYIVSLSQSSSVFGAHTVNQNSYPIQFTDATANNKISVLTSIKTFFSFQDQGITIQFTIDPQALSETEIMDFDIEVQTVNIKDGGSIQVDSRTRTVSLVSTCTSTTLIAKQDIDIYLDGGESETIDLNTLIQDSNGDDDYKACLQDRVYSISPILDLNSDITLTLPTSGILQIDTEAKMTDQVTDYKVDVLIEFKDPITGTVLQSATQTVIIEVTPSICKLQDNCDMLICLAYYTGDHSYYEMSSISDFTFSWKLRIEQACRSFYTIEMAFDDSFDDNHGLVSMTQGKFFTFGTMDAMRMTFLISNNGDPTIAPEHTLKIGLKVTHTNSLGVKTEIYGMGDKMRTIVYKNTCSDTTFIVDDPLLPIIITHSAMNVTPVNTQLYELITDTVSSENGWNGYHACRLARQYEIEECPDSILDVCEFGTLPSEGLLSTQLKSSVLTEQIQTLKIKVIIKIQGVVYASETFDLQIQVIIVPCSFEPFCNYPECLTYISAESYTLPSTQSITPTLAMEGPLAQAWQWQHTYRVEPACENQFSFNKAQDSNVLFDTNYSQDQSDSLKYQVLCEIDDENNAFLSHEVYFTTTIEVVHESSQNIVFEQIQAISYTKIDMCTITTLTPSVDSPQQLHAIIGKGRKFFTLQDYNDTASIFMDASSNPNYGYDECGVRNHAIFENFKDYQGLETSPAVLLADASFIELATLESEHQIQLSYGSDQNSDAGVHLISLHVSLADYPKSDNSVEFELTLYQQLSDLTIQDVNYTLSSQSLTIEIPQLYFEPIAGDSLDSFLIETFLEGAQEDIKIPAELGVLSDDKTLLVIDSIQESYIGLHRIKITYTGLEMMEGQNFEASFNLTVLQAFKDEDNAFNFTFVEIEDDEDESGTNITDPVDVANTTISLNETSGEQVKNQTIVDYSIYPADDRFNPGYQIYNFVPKTKQQKEEEALRQLLNATASIDAGARIIIKFEPQDIILVPENWSLIYNQTNWVDLEQEKREEYQQLADKYLQVNFIQNTEEPEQASFSSNLTHFTQAELIIQLKFSEPLYVSAGGVNDQVTVSLDEDFFMVINPSYGQQRLLQKDELGEQKFTIFTENLPRLMPSIEELEKLEENTSSASNVLVGQFMSSFVLQVFLSGALSMLWNIFNTMQIIFALNLLMISFPANVTVIYEAMNDIVNFQIVPKDKLYNEFFNPIFDLSFSEDSSEELESSDSEQDESQSYESQSSDFKGSQLVKYFFGFITLLLVLLIAITLVLACRKYVIPRCPSCIKTLATTIERKLLFNSILRAVLEIYFNTSIFFFISMRSINTYDKEGKINLGVILLLGGFCISIPYLVWDWLRTNIEVLKQKRYRQSYDSLYLNIEIDKGPQAVAFTFVFLVRRLLFAFVIGQVMQGVTIQIFTIYFLSCFLLGYYVSVMPMVDRINNYIQIFNELLVVQCTVWLFLFTNYVPDPVIQYGFAECYVYIIAVNIAINLLVLITILLLTLVKNIRRSYAKYKHKQAMKSRIKPQKNNNGIKSSESEDSSSSSSFKSSRITKEEQELFSSSVFRELYLNFLAEVQNEQSNPIEELVNHQRLIQEDSMVDDFLRCQNLESLGYDFSKKYVEPKILIQDQQQESMKIKKKKNRRPRFQVDICQDDEYNQDNTHITVATENQLQDKTTSPKLIQQTGGSQLLTKGEIEKIDQIQLSESSFSKDSYSKHFKELKQGLTHKLKGKVNTKMLAPDNTSFESVLRVSQQAIKLEGLEPLKIQTLSYENKASSQDRDFLSLSQESDDFSSQLYGGGASDKHISSQRNNSPNNARTNVLVRENHIEEMRQHKKKIEACIEEEKEVIKDVKQQMQNMQDNFDKFCDNIIKPKQADTKEDLQNEFAQGNSNNNLNGKSSLTYTQQQQRDYDEF